MIEKLNITFATFSLLTIALVSVFQGYDTLLLLACVGGIAGLSGYEIKTKNGRQ